MRKLLLIIYLLQNLAIAGEPDDFQKELDEINQVFTLSYPSSYYEPLNLTLEEKRYIQQKDEIQTFYLELTNKYLSRYEQNASLDPFTLTEKNLLEIHYKILEENFKSMNRYYAYNLDEIKYLNEIKKQSGLFARNFIARTQTYLSVETSSKGKINLRKIIKKLKFELKNSPFISPKGTRIRIRMKNRVVALTFIIGFIATNVLPVVFLTLGLPKYALYATFGIQPILKQLLVSALYNLKAKKRMAKFLGKQDYREYEKFRKYLYEDKPLMKSIKIIENDQLFKFRYRSQSDIRNAISYFTGKNYVNYSQIKNYFIQKNDNYSTLLLKAEELYTKDYDRTFFMIHELFKRKNEESAIAFFKDFDYSFLQIKNNVNDLKGADKWIHSILNIKDLNSFRKAIQSAPDDIPTIVFFEVLRTKILPIFADFKGIKYKNFRYLIKNLYIKEFNLTKDGVDTLSRIELNKISELLSKEALSSQGCKSWTNKILPKFNNFLKNLIF